LKKTVPNKKRLRWPQGVLEGKRNHRGEKFSKKKKKKKKVLKRGNQVG